MPLIGVQSGSLEGIDPRQLFKRLVANWYWFVLSLAIFVGVGIFINKTTVPQYSAKTVLFVKEEASEQGINSFLFNKKLGAAGRNFSNEFILLKSKPLVSQVLQKLPFEISYLQEGYFQNRELYKNSPIKVETYESIPGIPYNELFTCRRVSDSTFAIIREEQEHRFPFGEIVELEGFAFKISLVDPVRKPFAEGAEILFQIHPFSELVDAYRSRLQINLATDESTILVLSMEGTSPAKLVDFLNTLTTEIIRSDLLEKNTASGRTIDFIDHQISMNGDSLKTIERELQSFKNQNAALDLSIEGKQVFNNMQELEKEKAGILIASKYFEYLEDYLEDDSEEKILVPASLQIEDEFLSGQVDKLVDLQLRIANFKQTKNPNYLKTKREIEDVKNNIASSVKNLKATNEIRMEDIEKRLKLFSSTLQRMPAAERKLGNIERNRELNESIYLLLMQKKLEAAISAASNDSDFKLINEAEVSGYPISPKPFRNLMIGILSGLVFPFIVLLIREFLNNKIESSEQISDIPNLKLISRIPFIKRPKEIIKLQGPKVINGHDPDLLFHAPYLEEFRKLRTNLQFLTPDRKGALKLLITSSISHEGKSLCAQQLAIVYALMGKKAVLVDTDMRKAQGSESGEKGLSDYLGGFCEMADIIKETDIPGLYLVSSGIRPPNPAELMLGKRMQSLITQLEQEADFIVFDTAPIGLVADAMPLMSEVDWNLLVIRKDYTTYRQLMETNMMYIKNKVENISLVLNCDKTQQGKKSHYYHYYTYPSKKTKEEKPKARLFKIGS